MIFSKANKYAAYLLGLVRLCGALKRKKNNDTYQDYASCILIRLLVKKNI